MWPVIAAAALGAVAGELQGNKQRKAARQMQKEQIAEQRRLADLNLRAQAYGLQGPSPGMAQAPVGAYTGRETMQGALGLAQFAAMNPNLWGGGSDVATPQTLAMNTNVPQTTNLYADPNAISPLMAGSSGTMMS